MQDNLTHAPRRSDLFTIASSLLAGVPKGTILALLAVTGWSIAALSIAGAGRLLMFLIARWPF